MQSYGYKVILRHERFELKAKIPYKDKLQGKFEFIVANRSSAEDWIALIRPQLGVSPHVEKKVLELPTGEAKKFGQSVTLRATPSTAKTSGSYYIVF